MPVVADACMLSTIEVIHPCGQFSYRAALRAPPHVPTLPHVPHQPSQGLVSALLGVCDVTTWQGPTDATCHRILPAYVSSLSRMASPCLPHGNLALPATGNLYWTERLLSSAHRVSDASKADYFFLPNVLGSRLVFIPPINLHPSLSPAHPGLQVRLMGTELCRTVLNTYIFLSCRWHGILV
eukprot:jgi/Mesvir1/13214/Mv26300-RA.1